MSKERDKFLTEAMGRCWHSKIGPTDKINYCSCSICGIPLLHIPRINFSDWYGFGKLWEWAQGQEWWKQFIFEEHWKTIDNYTEIIHPDRFADALYIYLKERTP